MNYFVGEFVFAGQADIASVKTMAEEMFLSFDGQEEFISQDSRCCILSSSRLEKIHNAKSVKASAVFYNDSTQCLTLTCDTPGWRPVFYSIMQDRIIFATNIKAILKHPDSVKKFNNKTISSFISSSYNNNSFTVYKNISLLQPGSCVKINYQGRQEISKYDSSADVLSDFKLPVDEHQLAELVKDRICQVVAKKISLFDQTGLLLSGGLNSAVLLAAICQNSPAEKIKTFTVSFEGSKFSHCSAACKLAKYFGTNHTELKISAEPKGLIDWISDNYDQPFTDPAAVKTFLISQVVKKYVPSVISGEGGKLVFADYQRYRWLSKAGNIGPAKSLAYRLAGDIANILAPANEQNRFRKLARFGKILFLKPAEQYFMLQSLFSPTDMLKLMNPDFMAEHDIYVDDPFEWFCKLFEQGDCKDIVTRAQLTDLQTYLPENVLTRINTTSKAVDIDIKLPFICEELFKLGLNLPADIKYQTKQKDSILYRAFKEILPADIIFEKRNPLMLPISAWLRCELRREMLEALTDQKFQDMAIFYPPALAELVNEHLCKLSDNSRRLWAITILARWLIKNA